MKLLLLLLFPVFAQAAEFKCGGVSVSTEMNNEVLTISVLDKAYALPRNLDGVYELVDTRAYYRPILGLETLLIEVGPKPVPGATIWDMIVQASKIVTYRCLNKVDVLITPWKELRW